MEGLSEGSEALQDRVSSLLPGPTGSPVGPRLGKLEGLQEKPESAPYLTLHLMPTTPLTLGESLP